MVSSCSRIVRNMIKIPLSLDSPVRSKGWKSSLCCAGGGAGAETQPMEVCRWSIRGYEGGRIALQAVVRRVLLHHERSDRNS